MVGLCMSANGQGGVPLFAQLLRLAIPCDCQAQAVAGPGTEFLDAQRTELSPRRLKVPPDD